MRPRANAIFREVRFHLNQWSKKVPDCTEDVQNLTLSTQGEIEKCHADRARAEHRRSLWRVRRTLVDQHLPVHRLAWVLPRWRGTPGTHGFRMTRATSTIVHLVENTHLDGHVGPTSCWLPSAWKARAPLTPTDFTTLLFRASRSATRRIPTSAMSEQFDNYDGSGIGRFSK